MELRYNVRRTRHFRTTSSTIAAIIVLILPAVPVTTPVARATSASTNRLVRTLVIFGAQIEAIEADGSRIFSTATRMSCARLSLSDTEDARSVAAHLQA
jgi:hypothetical protein